jgi:three-Cys-motif partner protein
MLSVLKPRPTQTRIKHVILEKYMKAWGGIILRGLGKTAARMQSEGKRFDLHFVFVDCNASGGRFNGELEDTVGDRPKAPVFGSAIIGTRVLDELKADARTGVGIALRTNTILIENNPNEYKALLESLEMAGLSARVREGRDFAALKDGEIAVVLGDSTTMVNELCSYTSPPYTFSIFFLDPYGPKPIPLPFVRKIIKQRQHDVIINMPYQDLLKKTGMVSKASPLPAEIALMAHYDKMFGNADWRDIVKNFDLEDLWDWVDPEAPIASLHDHDPSKIGAAPTLEDKLRYLYWKSLQDVDLTLAVKSIGLKFPDKERTMFYLYLTTHDPNGALAMNEILWKANYQEYGLRSRLNTKQEQVRLESKMGMSLMPGFEIQPTEAPSRRRPDKTEVAEHIMKMVAGQTLSKRELYRLLADDRYFTREIDSALGFLLTKDRIYYEPPCTNDTTIRFGTK